MKIRLKPDLQNLSHYDNSQYSFCMEEFVEKTVFEPLAIKTYVSSKDCFIMCLDRYSRSIMYMRTYLFDIVDPKISKEWELVTFREVVNGEDRSTLFMGIPGLEDEAFMDRVIDREDDDDIFRFMDLIKDVQFPELKHK